MFKINVVVYYLLTFDLILSLTFADRLNGLDHKRLKKGNKSSCIMFHFNFGSRVGAVLMNHRSVQQSNLENFVFP